MTKVSFFLESGVLIPGTRVFYHLLCFLVIACISVCLRLQPMLLRLVAASKCFTIPGLHSLCKCAQKGCYKTIDALRYRSIKHLLFFLPHKLVWAEGACCSRMEGIYWPADIFSHVSSFLMYRTSPSEFVIPWSKFRKAVHFTQISVGMRFRMVFETEESNVRR